MSEEVHMSVLSTSLSSLVVDQTCDSPDVNLTPLGET